MMMTKKSTDASFAPDIWVSPEGSDEWTGRYPDPTGGDGPLRTIRLAVLLAREWRRRGHGGPSVRIGLRGGQYALHFPIELGPEDDGFCLQAAPGEEVVIDGSLPLAPGESEDARGRLWSFDVRESLRRGEELNSLFVNGERRAAARFPEEGFLSVMEEPIQEGGSIGGVAEHTTNLLQGSPSFRMDPGELAKTGDITGRRIILLNRWLIERLRVVSCDLETGELVFDRPTRLFLKPEPSRAGRGCRFYIEDLAEAPETPGAWTLDRAAGLLRYRPQKGEETDSADVRVPLTRQFFRIRGDLEGGRPVRGIELRGLRFRYADWSEPCNLPVWWDPYRDRSEWDWKESGRHFYETNGANPYRDVASSTQAAINIPGVVQFEAARDCALVDCEIAHVGFYAVGVGRGCRNLRIDGCAFHDLGAGGVIAEGTGADGPPHHATGFLTVCDSEIRGTGHVFSGACGVTLAHVARCTVAHNHIHDLSYTGISCGWVWGYAENPSYGHRIEANHIHDVGTRGHLSDMGAVYLLGYQPGTYVRGNYIHDVNRAEYGGWGLYPDEGCSGVIFENNVVARCASHCLFEHFGRQNIYRNNVFAAGGEAVIAITADRRGRYFDWPPPLTTFERNIFVADGTPVFSDYLGFFREGHPYKADNNLYWDLENGADVLVLHEKAKPGDPYPGINQQERKLGLDAFRAPGRDRNSQTADPGFADFAADDFRLSGDSPARALGFDPVDPAATGPRKQRTRAD